ncbi:hypothetical protein KM043_015152 [Ampulex compressa]|nr:hypothetical protein KM043_015152 [Ampulex compressa]
MRASRRVSRVTKETMEERKAGAKRREGEGTEDKDLVRALLLAAKLSGSEDNITVIVIFLTPPSEIAARPSNAHPLIHTHIPPLTSNSVSKNMDLKNFLMLNPSHQFDVNPSSVKQQQQQQLLDGEEQYENRAEVQQQQQPTEDNRITYEASSNGKHENGNADYDYEDFGPETDVDAVDDLVYVPPEKFSRKLFEDDEVADDDRGDEDACTKGEALEENRANDEVVLREDAPQVKEDAAGVNVDKEREVDEYSKHDSEEEEEEEEEENKLIDDNMLADDDARVIDNIDVEEKVQLKEEARVADAERNHDVTQVDNDAPVDLDDSSPSPRDTSKCDSSNKAGFLVRQSGFCASFDPIVSHYPVLIPYRPSWDYLRRSHDEEACVASENVLREPTQHVLIPDADNVADSEDSEDEWNYYRIDPNKEKECSTPVNEPQERKDEGETASDEPPLIEDNDPEIQSPVLEQPVKCESQEKGTPSELIDTEISAEVVNPTESDELEAFAEQKLGDMDFQLNPNAAEFIPVSPPALNTRLNLMHDLPISGSPLKNTSPMDDISVPSQNEFDEEICQRPSEIEGKECSNGDYLQQRTDFTDFAADKQKTAGLPASLDDSEISSTKAEFGDESVSFLAPTEFHRTGISTVDESFSSSERDFDPMTMSLTPGDFEAQFEKPVDLNIVHNLSEVDLGDENGSVDEEEEEEDKDTTKASTDVLPELINLASSDNQQLEYSTNFPEDKSPSLLGSSSPRPEEELTLLASKEAMESSTIDLLDVVASLKEQTPHVESLEQECVVKSEHTTAMEDLTLELEPKKQDSAALENEQADSSCSIEEEPKVTMPNVSAETVDNNTDLLSLDTQNVQEALAKETDTSSSMSPPPNKEECEPPVQQVDMMSSMETIPVSPTQVESILHADAPEFLPRHPVPESCSPEPVLFASSEAPTMQEPLKLTTEPLEVQESPREEEEEEEEEEEKLKQEILDSTLLVESIIEEKPKENIPNLTLESDEVVGESLTETAHLDETRPISPEKIADEVSQDFEKPETPATAEMIDTMEETAASNLENFLTKTEICELEAYKESGHEDNSKPEPVRDVGSLNLSESMQEFTGLEKCLQPEIMPLVETTTVEEKPNVEQEDEPQVPIDSKVIKEPMPVDTSNVQEEEQLIVSLSSESKEPDTSEILLDSKEPVTSEVLLESKELFTSEVPLESKGLFTSDVSLENNRPFASEDLLESKGLFTSAVPLESKDLFTPEAPLEDSELIASEVLSESKKPIAAEIPLESKEAITPEVPVEREELIAPEIPLKNEESIASEVPSESKELIASEAPLESKDLVTTEALLESKEPVTTEVLLESKEPVTTEVLLDSKEPVTTEVLLDSKEPVTTEALFESKEPLTTEVPLESKESIISEAPLESTKEPEVPKLEADLEKTETPAPTTAAAVAVVAAAAAAATAAGTVAAVQSKAKAKPAAKTTKSTAATKAAPKSTPTSPSKTVSSTSRGTTPATATKKPLASAASKPKQSDVSGKTNVSSTTGKLATSKASAVSKAASTTSTTKTATRTSITATGAAKSKTSVLSPKPSAEKKPTTNGEVKPTSKVTTSTTTKSPSKPTTSGTTGKSSSTLVKSSATTRTSISATTAKTRPASATTKTTSSAVKPTGSSGITTTTLSANAGANARPKTAPASGTAAKSRATSLAKSPVIDKQIKETANKQISLARTSVAATKTTRTNVSSASTASTAKRTSTTKTSTASGVSTSPTKKSSTSTSKVIGRSSAGAKTASLSSTAKAKVVQNGVSESVEISKTIVTSTITKLEDDVPKKDLSPVVPPTDNQLIMTAD